MATIERQRVSKGTSLIFFALFLTISSCSESTPDRDFAIEDLLIAPSAFPSSWRVLAQGRPHDQKEKRAIEATGFYLDTGLPELTGADLSIYRYQSVQSACSAFDKWERREFNSSSIGSLTPWGTPPELSYKSPIADQSRFACHISSITETTICQFMGQYEEFMVAFYTGFDAQHMTYSDVQRILEAIDARMAHYLKGKIH